MDDLDYAPVTLDDEEERKRRQGNDYPAPAPSIVPKSEPSPEPSLSVPGVSPRGINSIAPAPAAPIPNVAVQTRPQWKDYAPPVPHGWSKFGHIMAALNPATNMFFNELPEQRAERAYKTATEEYGAPAQEAKEAASTEETKARTEEEQARAASLRQPPQEKVGQTPEAVTIHDLMTGDNGKPRINPDTQKPYTYMEAYSAIKQAGAEAKPEKQPGDKDKDITDYLEANHLENTAANREKARKEIANRGKQEPGNYMPLYDDKGHVVGAWNPKTGHVNRSPELPGTTSQGAGISHKESQEFEKAYVQPAEAVEKSYQMMDQAYNEYKAAKEAGKELPTGAESMLALSTHLTTTFGNVKGARITKDMIEHHLGARSISDSAVVAIQKLTNGDVLSPDQWEAFHKLIKQSRDLSWKTAEKEAGRKQIPVDFLPEDLKNAGHEPKAENQGTEPARPAHVPKDYVYKENGPKGKGWYKP